MLRSILVFCFLLSSCDTSSFAESDEPAILAPVTHEELDLVFRSAGVRTVVNALNELKKGTHDRQSLLYVVDAWSHQYDKHPEWNSSMLTDRSVRINLADVIVQAVSNQELEFNICEIIVFARHSANDDDPEVAGRALLILARANHAEDVQLISNVALTAVDESVFRRAVLALSRMDRNKSEQALQMVHDSLEDRTRRDYINKLDRRIDP